jgi:hypothetical protein
MGEMTENEPTLTCGSALWCPAAARILEERLLSRLAGAADSWAAALLLEEEREASLPDRPACNSVFRCNFIKQSNGQRECQPSILYCETMSTKYCQSTHSVLYNLDF